MPTGTLYTNISVAGISGTGVQTRTGEGAIAQDPTLAAGITGTLSTRTSDTAGTLTVAEGHGVEQNDVIFIFWDDGWCYEAVAGVTTGTTIPFTDAKGDVLPTEDSEVVCSVETIINTDFDGDDVQMLALLSTQRAGAVFEDAGDDVIVAMELLASEPFAWAANTAIANPITGDAIDEIHVANGGTSEAQFKLGLVYDSVV